MGVLIVDDEAELADAIATYLQAFGLEAEYVVDGASALAAFDARPPKLVVLDVNLPDVNGFEVCRAMRAKSDVPILFLSARGSDDDQILALGLGGDDYVRKPVSLAVLLAKVRRMLDRLGQPRGFRDDWLVVDDDADLEAARRGAFGFDIVTHGRVLARAWLGSGQQQWATAWGSARRLGAGVLGPAGVGAAAWGARAVPAG